MQMPAVKRIRISEWQPYDGNQELHPPPPIRRAATPCDDQLLLLNLTDHEVIEMEKLQFKTCIASEAEKVEFARPYYQVLKHSWASELLGDLAHGWQERVES